MSKSKDSQSGAFYAVQGALFSCDQGLVPCPIVVTKNQRVMVQGKPAVTTDEATFQVPIAPFGQCNLNPNKQAPLCEYCGGNWDSTKSYENMVLDSSEMICSKYGGKITCLYHGQQQSVSMIDLSEFEEEMQVVTNSLYVLEKTDKTIIGKNNVEFGVTSIKVFLGTKELKKMPELFVRSNSRLMFHAFDRNGNCIDDKPVSWVLFQKSEAEVDSKDNKSKTKFSFVHSLHLFSLVGSPFSIPFQKTGTYYIEGMGNSFLMKYKNVARKIAKGEYVKEKNKKPPYDSSCSLTIKVESDNSMLSLSVGNEKLRENDTKYVKTGIPVKISVDMKYDFDETRDFIRYSIFAGEGENRQDVSDHLFCELEKQSLTFIPCNSEIFYTVELFLYRMKDGKTENKPIQSKSAKFFGVEDFVSVVFDNNSNLPLLRVGSSLTFKLKFANPEMQKDYENETREAETSVSSKIEMQNAVWTVCKGGKKMAEVKGPSFISLFKEEGNYTIGVNLTNTHVRTRNSSGSKCQVMIVANEVTNLDVSTVSNQFFKGIDYNLTMNYKYGEYDKFRDGNIRLEGDNLQVVCLNGCYKVRFLEEGLAELKVWMGERGPSAKSFEVLAPKVKYWEFCDRKKRPISQIGFRQSFYLHLCIPAWAQTEESKATLRLSLWLHNKTMWNVNKFEKIEVEELDECVKLNADGEVYVEVSEKSNLWSYLKPDETSMVFKGECFSGDFADLYFCVSNPISESVTDMRALEGERKGYYYATWGKYLQVTNKVYVSGYFANSKGRPLYDVLNFGTQVPIQLFLVNVSDDLRKRLTIRYYQNRKNGETQLLIEGKLNAPDEDGCVTNYVVVSAPEGEASKHPTLVFFKIYDGEKCLYTYPSTPYDYKKLNTIIRAESDQLLESLQKEEKKRNQCRSYLKQLKLILVNNDQVSSVISTLAPVVVGETIEREKKIDKNTRIKCPRCHESAEEMAIRLKKIFPNASSKNVEIVAKTYTKYMRRLHMDTCWIKAYFFAQVSVESGDSLIPVSETGIYSRSSLENVKPSQIFQGKWENKKWKSEIDTSGKKEVSSDNRVYKQGMKKKLDDIYSKTDELDKKRSIFNFMYSKTNGNGAEDSGDGWRYRGGGFVQITGRSLYMMVQRLLNVFYDKTVDIMKDGCDSFQNNIELATVASMCYLFGKYANQYHLCNGKGNEESVFFYCSKVMGNDVEIKDEKGEKTTNYKLKARRFKENMSKNFELDRCEWMSNQTSGFWTDPVKNPQACFFSQNGNELPYNAVFLDKKKGGSRTHQGLDIYAEEGTLTYACVDGEITRVKKSSQEKLDYDEDDCNQYIVLKISQESLELFQKRRKKYEPLHSGEIIEGPSFDKSSNDLYLVYMHMRQIFVSVGQVVSSGQPIGTSGRTGVKYGNDIGTSGPHIHFEIKSKDTYHDGLTNRCNPSLYLDVEQYKIKYIKNEQGKQEKVIEIYDYNGSVSEIKRSNLDSNENLKKQKERKEKGNRTKQGKTKFEDE